MSSWKLLVPQTEKFAYILRYRNYDNRDADIENAMIILPDGTLHKIPDMKREIIPNDDFINFDYVVADQSGNLYKNGECIYI